MSKSTTIHRPGVVYPPDYSSDLRTTPSRTSSDDPSASRILSPSSQVISNPSILALDLLQPAQDAASAYPEGGYGWVVTGAFLLLFQFLGILYAWGVIQAELSRTGLSSSLQLSLIGATSAFFLGMCCLPAAWMLDSIGPRYTVAIGVLGAGTCLIAAGSSISSLPGLIVLHGVGFGAFGSMIYLTAYIMPARYFLKKRGLSTGIASCGAGVGGAVWSIVIERLIVAWGLQWVYRFLGLSTLVVGGAAAAALKPGVVVHSLLPAEGRPVQKGMMKSSRFLRVLLSCFIASYPFFIPPYYISLYSQSIGFSAAQGALYTALFNVASGFGRIAFGLFADNAVGNINSWLSSLLLIMLSSLLIWANATNEITVVLFVLLCGAGSGGFFSLQTSVVAQIVGDNRLQSGVAWVEIAESFGYFAGPVSAGALLDAFGGTQKGAGPYKPAIFLVGGTTALALLVLASVRYSTSRELWKRV